MCGRAASQRAIRTLFVSLLTFLVLSLGCPGQIAPGDGFDDDSAEPGDDDTDTGDDDIDDDDSASDDDDSEGDDDAADDDAEPSEFDCSTIPDPPFDRVPLDGPRGYNDLVFDDEGAAIGSDGVALIRATSAVDWEVYAVGVGMIYKMGYLPNGDIVATRADRTIVKITSTGISTLLVGDFDGYGLAIGSDGMVYAGTNYTTDRPEIIRVDPSTGEFTQLIDAHGFPPRGLEFSHDYSRLYFGNTNNGNIYGVDLDENLDPVGDPEVIVTVPVGWHDTLEVDACGNLYVGSFFGHQIMRVDAHLTVTQLMSWNFDNYGHGFEWGSAAGGWNDTAIYVTHPYNGCWVDEVEIGVPGRQWEGEVIGRVVL